MSELQKALEEYLTLRRSLGAQLRWAGHLLHQFVKMFDQKGASFITTKLALNWATQSNNVLPVVWADRLAAVRGFARFRSAVDPRTEIPPQNLLPRRYHRKAPYIYSKGEIARLIEAAKQLNSPKGLRACMYSTMFGLIAVTGMRMSEPLALDCEDVDLVKGLLTIRSTKFGKSRLVPLHATTQRVLQQYVNTRDRIFPKPDSRSFFVSERGTRLARATVHPVFVDLSRKTGLRGPSDRRGPRLHDLRHTFAVRTLLRWYRAGVDVERHLPKLATYLGHAQVTDTYWYLSATPELLRLAAARLDTTRKGALS
jgi:integrase